MPKTTPVPPLEELTGDEFVDRTVLTPRVCDVVNAQPTASTNVPFHIAFRKHALGDDLEACSNKRILVIFPDLRMRPFATR